MKNITLTALLYLFTVALSAQNSTFKLPDSCVVANTQGLCADCGYYYLSQGKSADALTYFEKAYTFGHTRELLWMIYQNKTSLRLPFDTAIFFKYDHYDDLLYYANAMYFARRYDLAATICKKAIAANPAIEAKLLLHHISRKGYQPFDLKLITTDLTSADDMTESADYLFENQYYGQAKEMYESSERIRHAPHNIIGLHKLSLIMKDVFDMDLFLKSKDAHELILYADYFSTSAYEKQQYGDRILLLKQASLLMELAVAQKEGKQYLGALAQNYSNQSWYLLLDANPQEAEKMASKSLAVAPEFEFAYTNLAAALLLQGKYDQAEKVYRQWMDKPLNIGVEGLLETIGDDPSAPSSATFREAFLQDLKDLERVGLTHPDFSKIRALLEKK